MEQNYVNRKTRESRSASGADRAFGHRGGSSHAANSALTAALGGETLPDPGLGGRMAARMAATFGPGFGAMGGDASVVSGAGVVQMKPKGEPDHGAPVSGSPDAIRSALEQKSSVSLKDVSVHYNSPKPAEIGALAYARGTDVFMGPGQEKYLGHELTHVVQQKQGLVRSTGSVGGMPVNTSPALESAADHMQVSAAPAAASAPASGGVVQGVFKDANGKVLSEKDVEAMISMMEGSLESHGKQIAATIADKDQMVNKEDRRRVKPLQKSYEKRRAAIRKDYLKKMRSDEEFSAEELLGGEISNAQAASKIDPMQLNNQKLQNNVVFSGTDFGINALGSQQTSKDTTAGYEHTANAFSLADRPMEGVSDIADYDPSQYNFDELIDARMGNSTTYDTMDKNSEEFQKKKDEFTEATEVARQGAIGLQKSGGNVGFGDLFSLFSGINKTTRKGEASGGKLRGKGVKTGNDSIAGVGSGKLPEDVFRTFSTIADQMNKIREVKDRDLQKTQAIQLASFAYQMTVSEHMFDDANGRSCRLFSDAILQSFGLPPHSPVDEERTISGIMGNDFDFEKGKNVFFQGVQASDRTMKDRGMVPPPAPDASAAPQPETPAPAAPQTMGEKTSDESFGYRTAPVPEELDPETASYDEKLSLLYHKIKNPDPSDDEDTISARKRLFAETRAQQMQEQERQQAAPAKEKAKKKWWQFWKK